MNSTIISLFLGVTLLSLAQPARTDSYNVNRPVASAATATADKLPYIGSWSNGRGETLKVTASTLRFNSDKAVTYRDVTKVTDGNYFLLEVTAKGKVNYFSKYLSLTIDDDEMKMVLYNSYEDMLDGKNPQGESTWSRDK
jgi:hypothetical protein